jgi:hypothetical protein
MVVKEGSPEAVRVLEKSVNWKDLRISDVRISRLSGLFFILLAGMDTQSFARNLFYLGLMHVLKTR